MSRAFTVAKAKKLKAAKAKKLEAVTEVVAAPALVSKRKADEETKFDDWIKALEADRLKADRLEAERLEAEKATADEQTRFDLQWEYWETKKRAAKRTRTNAQQGAQWL